MKPAPSTPLLSSPSDVKSFIAVSTGISLGLIAVLVLLLMAIKVRLSRRRNATHGHSSDSSHPISEDGNNMTLKISKYDLCSTSEEINVPEISTDVVMKPRTTALTTENVKSKETHDRETTVANTNMMPLNHGGVDESNINQVTIESGYEKWIADDGSHQCDHTRQYIDIGKIYLRYTHFLIHR